MANGYAPIYDRVTEYASRVVSGKVVSGELHVLACKRHLNDLKRQRKGGVGLKKCRLFTKGRVN